MQVLRDGLLREQRIAVAGGPRPELLARLRELGASVELLELDARADDGQADRWVSERQVNALVFDAADAGADPAGDAPPALDALEEGWAAIRAVAASGLIPAGSGGKLVLIAPSSAAGAHAEAARAALENLARTLSVEWARFAITVTCLAPGPDTTVDEIATVVAFLVSRAGDYFSGCRLDLGLIRRS